jgi:mono/diheme cytochrome c family protein
VPIGRIARAVVVLGLTLASGCGTSAKPEFRVNLEGRDPDEIRLLQHEAITEAMGKLFGTPDHPVVPEGVPLNLEMLEAAAGPVARFEDEAGRPVNQTGLYRQHCAGCHGISGDGAGPLASALDPYPRDFRNGVFKYTSTLPGAKPTRGDLERTLLRGIPATAMPSFAKLAPDELAALIEYVKYLSIRGETEIFVIQLVVDEEEFLPLGKNTMDIIIEDGAWFAAESWALPEEAPEEWVVTPQPRPRIDTPELRAASIARGRELYLSEDAQCVKCHGKEGRGDGEQNELYDVWNEPKKGRTAEQTDQLARLFTLPIQQQKARDFREGAFRGGANPEDLYLRVYAGIKGTQMPGVGPTPNVDGALTPEEIWHVVNYVLSLAP